ncbi:unnamed protein product, partial [Porites evermanni]
CGKPPPVLNAQDWYQFTSIGTNVTYVCNPGYTLFGPTRRTCQANGKWDGVKPYCFKMCSLPTIPSSMYVVQPINYQRVYKTGEMIILGCKKGLTNKVNGDPIKVCISGKWTQSSFKCGGISFLSSKNFTVRGTNLNPPPPPPFCTCGAISLLVFNSKSRSNYILVASLLLLRLTEAYVTSTVLLNCPIKDEIRAVDSLSDLRILFWLCLWSEIILLISNQKILNYQATFHIIAAERDTSCDKMLRRLLRNPPKNTIININIRLSKARYRCREGYMLEGKEIRSCIRGQWVEKKEPKCTGYSSCGVSSFDFRSRIVGGKNSKRGWWPWQVGIYRYSEYDHLNLPALSCGGALISRRWVLTVAGCYWAAWQRRLHTNTTK